MKKNIGEKLRNSCFDHRLRICLCNMLLSDELYDTLRFTLYRRLDELEGHVMVVVQADIERRLNAGAKEP